MLFQAPVCLSNLKNKNTLVSENSEASGHWKTAKEVVLRKGHGILFNEEPPQVWKGKPKQGVDGYSLNTLKQHELNR